MNNTEAVKIGENIKEARKKKGLTLQQLASLMGIKAVPQLSQYETGIRKPKEETLQRIAECLDTTTTALRSSPEAAESIVEHLDLAGFEEYLAMREEAKALKAVREISDEAKQELIWALDKIIFDIGIIQDKVMGIFCPKCGRASYKGRFCPSCGTKMRGEE